MHELSIVSSVVESVTESLRNYPGARVTEVRLRVGVLSAVIEDSLQFCYGIAIDGTPLAGSRLVITTVPVTVYCRECDCETALDSLQSFRCPRCGAPSEEVRHGRELEIEAIEIEQPEEAATP
ncbi:MAG: hydrogenase maturation nickel metallochaperone HypA [Acidobacteriota bacterium]